MSVPASLPLMIVDDDDDLRNTLADIMTAQGYQVAAFGDARAALAALEDGQTPFLILLDLMMPGMSGWEFRAAQLENPTLAPIPVVVVTAANALSDGAHTPVGHRDPAEAVRPGGLIGRRRPISRRCATASLALCSACE